MAQVEIEHVLQWRCPDCAAVHHIEQELKSLSEEQYRAFFDVEEWEELPDGWDKGMVGCMPQSVTCSRCGSDHRTNVAAPDDVSEFRFGDC